VYEIYYIWCFWTFVIYTNTDILLYCKLYKVRYTPTHTHTHTHKYTYTCTDHSGIIFIRFGVPDQWKLFEMSLLKSLLCIPIVVVYEKKHKKIDAPQSVYHLQDHLHGSVDIDVYVSIEYYTFCELHNWLL
jgi:hypothetical protein